ncbi:hypothetical protein VIGAN_09197600, partial [Vigna angularis var. angularis]
IFRGVFLSFYYSFLYICLHSLFPLLLIYVFLEKSIFFSGMVVNLRLVLDRGFLVMCKAETGLCLLMDDKLLLFLVMTLFLVSVNILGINHLCRSFSILVCFLCC